MTTLRNSKKSSKKTSSISHHISIKKSQTNAKQITKVKKPVKSKTYFRAVANQSSTIYGGVSLSQELSSLIRENGESADIGVIVKSMNYGDILYSKNVHIPLTPASTLKVLTAEAALVYLKPDYRFTTQLLTDGKTIKNGILQGNLYVVLSGDPSLTYNELVDLMLTLRTQQIEAVTGNVYIDHTAYDQIFYGPDWDYKDKVYCYAAPISASIINHNCLPLKVSPSNMPGQIAKIETFPKYFYPIIKNYVTTAPKHTRCGVRLSNDLSAGLEIEGCLTKGREAIGLSYVVTDIFEYNRALFRTVLSQLGVRVDGQVTFGSAPSNPAMIGYHSSKPLADLVNEMLKKSDNIIAGALFKKVGQIYTRKQGSWENGSYAVSQILSRAAGVNISGLRVLDGSGLSPSNQVTPSQLMQVLSFAYRHTATSDAFWDALPIAGVDGTLKHRLGNLARKVRAKTGTISGVVSLAGYVTTSDKEMLAFVIMVNGNKGMMWKYRDLEDKIVTALSRYKRM
jgi:D-alanyl-D-alanine carboxypeptidase/D-alanyl-D-alanine-endopeptidase (penicillin-binding protein 4)